MDFFQNKQTKDSSKRKWTMGKSFFFSKKEEISIQVLRGQLLSSDVYQIAKTKLRQEDGIGVFLVEKESLNTVFKEICEYVNGTLPPINVADSYSVCYLLCTKGNDITSIMVIISEGFGDKLQQFLKENNGLIKIVEEVK